MFEVERKKIKDVLGDAYGMLQHEKVVLTIRNIFLKNRKQTLTMKFGTKGFNELY